MKSFLIIVLSFSFISSYAQDVVEGLEQLKTQTVKSGISIQYLFTKRNLSETEFMESYRKERIASDNVYISPNKIDFDLHTFGIRYEPNDVCGYELAVSYMTSRVNLTGQLVTGTYTPEGEPDSVKIPIFGKVDKPVGSEGVGDTRIGARCKVYRRGDHAVMTSVHLNIPTGSVKEQEDGYVFPYAGQLGSGTYDLLPELKYNYRKTGFVAGAKLAYTLRTGKGESDYRMGDQIFFDSFVGYDYKRKAGVFLRGRVRDWGASSDPRYDVENPKIDDPYVQRGRRWEISSTVRTGFPLPWNLGAVIIEGGVPVYQDQKSGEVQLETAWYLTSRVVTRF